MGKLLKKKHKKKKKKSVQSGSNKLSAVLPAHKVPDKQEVPLYNFFEDHRDIEECLDSLILSIEDGYFLIWEAVVLMEQGLPLTDKQEKALGGLISFSDYDDEPIFYIDEIPRPNEPWYEILRKIVPKLILDPFETYEIHNEIYHEGWLQLVECLEEHAKDLSLPKDISSPIDVVPPEIRHRLWLQYCFDVLSGLGQEKELTLANDEQKDWRIQEFIDALREYKDSVKYFDLTIEKLFKLVKLPPKDEEILTRVLFEKLKMKAVKDYLHNFL